MADEAKHCPRCLIPLFEGGSDAASLLGCGRCGGVWLDTAASTAVFEGTARALTGLSEQARVHATVAVDRRPGNLPCPTCAQPLTREFIPNTAIEMDVCAADGTWLDAGELRLVALVFAKLPEPLRFSPEDYVEPPGPWERMFDSRYRPVRFDVEATIDALVTLASAISDGLRRGP